MNSTAKDEYFEVYWRARYDARSFDRRVRTLRRNYAAWLPKRLDENIVEIGPGHGELLEMLRSDGFRNVEAIDVDRRLVEALNARGYANVGFAGDTVDWLRSSPGRWSRIFLLHVLEHVPPAATAEFLAAIRDALAPGGLAVIEVPNMANFVTGPHARWADYTHTQGFTSESLEAAVIGAGFKVRSCFGISRHVSGPREFAASIAQGFSNAMVRVLLKANSPGTRTLVNPTIAVVGAVP